MGDPPEGARDLEARTRALHDLAARAANLDGREASEQAAVELIGRLEEVGVDLLLLKGPALARLLYHPGEHRGYYDVDVLLAPDNLQRARDALSALGYENRSEPLGVDNFHGAVHGETWMRPRDAAVDLHWSLAGCTVPPHAVWATLYGSRTTIELKGRAAWVPGRDALALHVALHAADHGPGALKALGDLARALDRWPQEDWRAAVDLAEALGATTAFAAGLRLLPEGAAIAQALGLPATPALTWTILHRDARPRGTFHLEALRQSSGRAARLDVLRRSLFPPSAWMVRRFAWARRGRLALVAAYCAHLARAPLWAARAWRFDRLARRAGKTPPEG